MPDRSTDDGESSATAKDASIKERGVVLNTFDTQWIGVVPPAESASRRKEYVVVARRYRPQDFEELIGQEHVGRALSGAITSSRVGHAYLFTGARGVGKTSTARIFAKALNCERGPTPSPCNQCDICLSISTGDDVDVLEIDGASNRGIEEIRELRQNVKVRPSRSRFKIYIIDEVHMLTKEAFNALLKTLEEPPEHVKFIFCTTEAEKIPITILSRCQRFDFAGIQTREIAARLRKIVDAEGVTADQAALEVLARRAAGSMRDSQSLLEQLLSFGGQRITVADVHAMLGTAGNERLGTLVSHLVARRPAEVLAELDAALAEGVDVGQLLEQLLGYFRDMMTAAVGADAEGLIYTWGEEQERASEAGRRLGLETILAAMQVLDQTLARLRYSTHRRTLAELALVRIARLEDLETLPALVAQLRDGAPATLAAGQAQPPPRAAAVPRPVPSESSPTQAAPAPESTAKKKPEETGEAPQNGNGAVSEPGRPIALTAEAAPIPLTAEAAPAIWRQVLARLSDMTAEHAAAAERAAIAAPNRLVVSFRTQYTFSKSVCERPEQSARLEKALAEVTGRPVRVEFELLDDPLERPAENGPPARTASPRERLFEAAAHPFVQRACELFDAQPIRVEGPDG
jgi:DNA polymerase-3 subunit gamma/tau